MLYRLAAVLLGLVALPANAAVTLDTSWLTLQTQFDLVDQEPGLSSLSYSFGYNNIGGCENVVGECGDYEDGQLELQLTNSGFDYSVSMFQSNAITDLPPNTFVDFVGSYRAGREMRFRIVETRSAVVTRCNVSCLNSFGFTVNQMQLGPNSWQLDVNVGTSGSVLSAAQQIDHRVQFQVSEVPEPASWALLIAGFGLVGAAARRGRRDQTRLQPH
jgi:hypothetical protein